MKKKYEIILDVESSSSEEEESAETESTATVSTLTASASALTLEETHLDSGNDADQLPFVSNPTSTSTATVCKPKANKDKICNFCSKAYTSFGFKRHQNKCPVKLRLENINA